VHSRVGGLRGKGVLYIHATFGAHCIGAFFAVGLSPALRVYGPVLQKPLSEILKRVIIRGAFPQFTLYPLAEDVVKCSSGALVD